MQHCSSIAYSDRPSYVMMDVYLFLIMKGIAMENIRLFALDVDGTMTTGEIMYDANGIETKIFNAKDGFAIKSAVRKGYKIAIITGRQSTINEYRAKELDAHYLYQNIRDKAPILRDICAKENITPDQIAYVGDDVNDLSAMEICGFTACPADASNDIRLRVNYVSTYDGGKGAVRDVIEMIMKKQNNWVI